MIIKRPVWLQIQDRKFWEQQENERIAQAIADRQLAVEHSQRLARMAADKQAFIERLQNERNSVYQVSTLLAYNLILIVLTLINLTCFT